MKGAWVFAALAACSVGGLACGGEGGGIGAGGGWYDDPSDFSPGDCGDAPVASIDPVGVWHADVIGADGSGLVTFRIDQAGGGLNGLIYGREAEDVGFVDGDLILRLEERPDGSLTLHAMDLCGVDPEGRLRGELVSCYGSQCFVGQVMAYRVTPLDEPEADGMTLLSEWRGADGQRWAGSSTTNVRHHGAVAYVVGLRDGLRLVDLADPSSPADLGHLPPRYPDSESYNDVKIYQAEGGGIFAFLASTLRGVVVADVTDPTAPVEVAVFPDPPIGTATVSVHTLFLEGDRLYISGAGTQIFDVSEPAAPERLGGYTHPMVGTLGGFVHDLSVRDHVVYLNYWNLGMQVVDAADPAAPVLVGSFDDYPRRTSHSNWVTEAGGRLVAVHGDEDLDAHVRIVDVDPASATAFQEIGSYQTRPEISVHNIMAVGERALVTYYQDGLRVLDLADPTAPVEIAHYASWPGTGDAYGRGFFEGAIGVDHDAERDLVLLADTHRGLIVLRLDR